ncbi:hypothetical protein BN77_p40047 [Rhizobium mesoamericanum STM3625]|uniref:Uncharacterized protein n=1 Tax=Rhizobium mesoamericanum STM3625 TaxID=1211777 RepID=K0PSS0_9HYPH|nr:hypothetical protein BN77_p40047 [Rhizobium mesoamericanum STM3625]
MCPFCRVDSQLLRSRGLSLWFKGNNLSVLQIAIRISPAGLGYAEGHLLHKMSLRWGKLAFGV